VLGASGAPGIWLNLGHGSSGWALACGCARVLAEQIGGRAAPIDLGGLGIERLK
jgi:D-amino-acid dehydrogenase